MIAWTWRDSHPYKYRKDYRRDHGIQGIYDIILIIHSSNCVHGAGIGNVKWIVNHQGQRLHCKETIEQYD